MSLPYSDMFFVKAYPRECTESFWDGHVNAFEFFGGVPNRISYDNSRIAICKITGCHQRILTSLPGKSFKFLFLRMLYVKCVV